MNKRFLLMGAAAVLIMATVVGSALGAGQASSKEPVAADLKAADFSIEWSDRAETSETVPVTLDASRVMPGDVIELKDSKGNDGIYNVDNTGSADAYIRVTVKSYWADLDGNPLEELDPTAFALTANEEDWINAGPVVGENGEDAGVLFYCKTPVAPGKATEDLLKTLTISTDIDNSYTDKKIVLEAVAEGVQFAGSQYNDLNAAGIEYEWGVKVTLADDGSIESVA